MRILKPVCVLLAAVVLAGCTAGTTSPDPTPARPAGDPPGTRAEVLLVDGAESGHLLLAACTGRDIYYLGVGDTPLSNAAGEPMDPADLRDGMRLAVFFGGDIMESYPAQFGGVASITVTAEPDPDWPDLCGLYLQVLEDLWAADPGLNSGATIVGLDLSAAPGSLPESALAAIAWRFYELHDIDVIRGTWQELADAGYIDAENLIWEDGCLFTVRTAEETDCGMPDGPVRFTAEKWRSGLGAYIFGDCQAKYDPAAGWSYTVGFEAIA